MLIAIDFDGVIVDSLPDILSISDQVRSELGSGRQPQVQDIHGLENLTFKEFGRKIDVVTDLLNEFERRVLEKLGTSANPPKLFPGMRDCLLKISQHHTISVVTSNNESNVRRAFNSGGLEALSFNVQGTPSESKVDKISVALQLSGCRKDQAVMVGDGISDIRAGKVVGVHTVAVTWGFHREELLRREKPDHIVKTPLELAICLGVEQIQLML